MAGFDILLKNLLTSFGFDPKEFKEKIEAFFQNVGAAIQRFDKQSEDTKAELRALSSKIDVLIVRLNFIQAENSNGGTKDIRPESNGTDDGGPRSGA